MNKSSIYPLRQKSQSRLCPLCGKPVQHCWSEVNAPEEKTEIKAKSGTEAEEVAKVA